VIVPSGLGMLSTDDFRFFPKAFALGSVWDHSVTLMEVQAERSKREAY